MTIILLKASSPGKKQPFASITSTMDGAKIYSELGFHPVALHPKSKKPKGKWKYGASESKIDLSSFAGKAGVALKLGSDFGGLVDVDLDSPEARDLAKHFLPSTKCVFGHASSPASHYVYRVDGPVKTVKFQAHIGGETTVFVECRSENVLCVFPPSIHPSEEKVCFEPGKAGLPSQVEANLLRQRAGRLAAAALLVRCWPKSGGIRQDIALALSGGMIRGGIVLEDVATFIRWVADVAGDEEAEKRAEAALTTGSNLKSEKPVTGWPTLVKLLGPDGPEIVKKCRKWLDIKESIFPFGASTLAAGTLDVTTADQVKPQEIDWFWEGMIPMGAITILDGDPGTGKSTICMYLAALQSAGGKFPDGTTCSQAGALVLSIEDSMANTIVPRLLAAGAHLPRVWLGSDIKLPDGNSHLVSIPDDLPQLRGEILENHIRLMIIDPLVAFLGSKVEIYNDQHVRRALGELKMLAEDTGVAVVCVRHLNKKKGASAMYRGGGSIGLIAAARSALLVGFDPYDPDARVLASTKANLCAPPQAWRYRIVEKQIVSKSGKQFPASTIDWLGATDITASQLVNGNSAVSSGALHEAVKFLKKVLAEDTLAASHVFALGKEQGHAISTLRRAFKKLGVQTEKVHKDGDTGKWMWFLPKPSAKESDTYEDEP